MMFFNKRVYYYCYYYIDKNALGFPVAEHSGSNGHTAADALIRGIKLGDGNKQRKKQEMRLIFRIGTC